MSFIFIMACNELFDKARVTIEHSLSRGLYCEVHTNTKLQDFDLKNIKNKEGFHMYKTKFTRYNR